MRGHRFRWGTCAGQGAGPRGVKESGTSPPPLELVPERPPEPDVSVFMSLFELVPELLPDEPPQPDRANESASTEAQVTNLCVMGSSIFKSKVAQKGIAPNQIVPVRDALSQLGH